MKLYLMIIYLLVGSIDLIYKNESIFSQTIWILKKNVTVKLDLKVDLIMQQTLAYRWVAGFDISRIVEKFDSDSVQSEVDKLKQIY